MSAAPTKTYNCVISVTLLAQSTTRSADNQSMGKVAKLGLGAPRHIEPTSQWKPLCKQGRTRYVEPGMVPAELARCLGLLASPQKETHDAKPLLRPHQRVADIPQRYKDAAARLVQIESRIDTLGAVAPTNEDQQRQQFLDHFPSCTDPVFTYGKPVGKENQPEQITQDLKAIDIKGSDEIAELLRAQKHQLALKNKIVAAMTAGGDPSRVVQACTRALYGEPSKFPGLIKAAKKILRATRTWRPPEQSTRVRLADALEEELQLYGLDKKGWRIERVKGAITSVLPARKVVRTDPDEKVPMSEALALQAHEIGFHALRAENGFGQSLTNFATGLPGYETTEEGLAVLAELTCGKMSVLRLRLLAARVLAIDSVVQGKTFNETYALMRERCHFNDNVAWRITVRAHRGGGYIKDHIYLAGLLDVVDHIRRGVDIEPLLVGKVGTEHLEQVVDWLVRGVLQPGGLKPWFWQALTKGEQIPDASLESPHVHTD